MPCMEHTLRLLPDHYALSPKLRKSLLSALAHGDLVIVESPGLPPDLVLNPALLPHEDPTPDRDA